MIGDNVFIVAENSGSFLSFNIRSNLWRWHPPAPIRTWGFALIAFKSKLYCAGGHQTAAVAEFDPTTDKWTIKAPLHSAIFSECIEAGGNLYAIGGTPGGLQNEFSAVVEAFDPEANAWSPRSSLPFGRHGFSSAVISNRIYVIGGFTNSSTAAVASVDEFDPIQNNWRSMAQMPTPRGNGVAFVSSGMIFVVGGYPGPLSGPQTPLAPSPVEAFDPVSNSWKVMKSSPDIPGWAVAGNELSAWFVNTTEYGYYLKRFEPEFDRWRTLPSPSNPLAYGSFLTLWEKKLFALTWEQRLGRLRFESYDVW